MFTAPAAGAAACAVIRASVCFRLEAPSVITHTAITWTGPDHRKRPAGPHRVLYLPGAGWILFCFIFMLVAMRVKSTKTCILNIAERNGNTQVEKKNQPIVSLSASSCGESHKSAVNFLIKQSLQSMLPEKPPMPLIVKPSRADESAVFCGFWTGS